jgi:hypothetical protein
MGDVLLGVIDGQPAAPPTASVEPKMLKAGRKKATVTEEPAQVETPAKEPSEHEVKVARLRELHQELLKSR